MIAVSNYPSIRIPLMVSMGYSPHRARSAWSAGEEIQCDYFTSAAKSRWKFSAVRLATVSIGWFNNSPTNW
ncbi:MAG: hypothetical protein JWR69_3239 [Pedosphaera sp.]|nr:hypothetical protein [Pedosphaera sp.]